MRLNLKVVPKSSRNRIEWLGDTLKVCVTAAPEKGRANAVVEQLLAQALGLARDDVRVVAGLGAPRKIVEIAGLSEADVRARLAQSRP